MIPLEQYKKLQRKFLHATFNFWQMLGFHITPNHFYQPIPDTRKLTKEFWQKKSELVGIDLQEQKQIELLATFSGTFRSEYDAMLKNNEFGINDSEFRSVDAEILYCMVRHTKPKRIIEVGSGTSTLIMLKALAKNKQEYELTGTLTSIDPYPKGFVLQDTDITLIKKEVQDMPLDTFNVLEENDIFFIDSSHILKIGSDVQYEYLEILPRLNKGVLVHIHDIFLPMEYPKDWIVKEHLFFNEQYLLQAFLMFNKEFEVLWAGSYMHLKNHTLLEEAFNSYNHKINWPGSFWIKRTLK